MKSLAVILLLCLSTVFTPVDDVAKRFPIPVGYHQVTSQSDGFGQWLNKLPLKHPGAHTHIYNGAIARTDAYTAAVVDLSVGKQDLQQCADAVMRLRAEYLYSQKQYSKITFNFTSGFRCDYVHYADGYRYVNNKWVLKSGKDYSYSTFLKYMNLVFSYAGTLSLEKELVKTNADQLQTGDVFIHGGSPGHCFIVLNVCEDDHRHKKFLLAQSFMPAQEIQIVQADGNPWFNVTTPANIPYGELISSNYLRRFKN